MKRSVTLSDVLLPACPGDNARKHHHVHHLRNKAQGKDEYNDGPFSGNTEHLFALYINNSF